VLILAAAMLTALATRVEANPHPHDDDGGGDVVNVPVDVSVSSSTAVDVAGDTLNLSTGGNRAYNVVAPGLGDVDIRECLGSTQWSLLVGGKQKLVLNQVCMAEFYLKRGRYDLAAQALCNQPEILMEYSNEKACEDSHDFTPVIPDHDVHSRSDEFEEVYAQQEHEIEFLQEENASIVGRLDDLTALLEQAPARAPAPVYIQQEPEPQYSDEQFDAVWMALKGGDEDEQ
jgi:hypothetical protein